MNTISFTQFSAVPLITAAILIEAAPGVPLLEAIIPCSYLVLFRGALCVWLCTAAQACLVLRRKPIWFIPAILYGTAILCGCSFTCMEWYTRIILAGSALHVAAAESYLFFRKQQSVHDEDGFERLSPRECDVARLLLTAKTTSEIAEVLFISPATVKTHIQSIYRKYEVSGRMEFSNKISSGHKNHPDG